MLFQFGFEALKKSKGIGSTATKTGKVVIGGDGQVSLGNTIMKGNARKVRRLYKNQVIAGFAGGTADAFTLFELFEAQLEKYQGHLTRAAVELAKTGNHLLVIQTAHFTCVALHYGITHRNLPVTANNNLAVATNRKNSGASILIQDGVLFGDAK